MSYSAREIVLKILIRTRKDGEKAEELLEEYNSQAALPVRERSLVTRLSLGVIQNSNLCDFYINHYVKGKIEPKVRDILRLGVYQILFMDRIPDRAAINEAVSLCKKSGIERASGLVNAVLRKISADHAQSSLPNVPKDDPVQYLSITYSHDASLVSALLEEYGYAHTEAFLIANNQFPPITLHINTDRISVDAYCQLLVKNQIPFEPCSEMATALRLYGVHVPDLPGYKEGFFYIQDIAPARVIEAVIDPSIHSVLDVCSAPGGKTIAAYTHLNGKGSFLSCDVSSQKVELIRQNLTRLGMDAVALNVADATNSNYGACFDLVIADVPCSGYGVIRKKPEIKHKPLSSVSGLPELQLSILNNAALYVKPGGTLLYSTCTILKAENECVVQAFLEAHPGFELRPFLSSKSGMYTFWPQADDSDGFFAAKLVKVN